jgi:hypothetical protein
MFLFILALAGAHLFPLRSAEPALVPDWTAVVGTYPALGTLPSQEELAILHWLQDTRTPADVARCDSENKPGLENFLQALGSPMDPSAFPATQAMLHQAKEDLKPVVAALKAGFNRPRPYAVDATLAPALPGDGMPSFPSHHATLGALLADLMSRLDPADQDTLVTEGGLIGDDRVVAGLHWPSDVVAGQRLGKVFAAYWLASPGNWQYLQDAEAEWPGPR